VRHHHPTPKLANTILIFWEIIFKFKCSLAYSCSAYQLYLFPCHFLSCGAMTHFHPCEQLKQPWTLKPLIAEMRDRGPNSKRTLLPRPLLEGDGESESRRKRGELGSPLSNLILLLLGSLSPLAGSWAQREGFFPSLPPSLLVYLFDFTPCRPKWPLPCIQNYFIPFCSEADSHREPWKGPLEEPGCVFSQAFTGSVSIGFRTFCCCSRCGNQFGL